MSKKSAISTASVGAAIMKELLQVNEPLLDTLKIKIRSLRISDDNPKQFLIKLTYFDQLILSGAINSIGARDKEQCNVLAEGTMSYDPSDYEKMCLFADCPLVVTIQPLRTDSQPSLTTTRSVATYSTSNSTKSSSVEKSSDISCCNIDILPIFLGDEAKTRICIKKRMEPMIKKSVLHSKSWDCLPLVTMELSVARHSSNAVHHRLLKEASWMQLTLIASYNMILPPEPDLVYTAISKTPLFCEFNTGLARFNEGTKAPKNFNATNFYGKWESLSVGDNVFSKGDAKFAYNLMDVRNKHKIDLYRYMLQMPQDNTIAWTSFHRSLFLKKSSEHWFAQQIRQYKWPLEIYVQTHSSVYSFMAFLDLFQLLYPGEQTVRLAVPLLWLNESIMLQECNCASLNAGDNRVVSSSGTVQKTERAKTESTVSTEVTLQPSNDTGADENPAFIVIEVKLARPLHKVVIPTRIMNTEIDKMLKKMENIGPIKRRCFGRIASNKKWQSSAQLASTALRRVPYFGTSDFSLFVRQLSETKTRVELTTTFWQDAALFVNNNFIVQQYLHSEEIFEEMVMMTHACLVRLACEDLLETNQQQKETDTILKAARQSRQMRDNHHAMDLYLQMTVNNPRDPNIWRELSTCLKDINKDWARISLYNSVTLNPRHPLTLISACDMVFEEDPVAAEQFFVALISLYPYWMIGWIIASVYYHDRQQFSVCDAILKFVHINQRESQTEEITLTRGWERELGDWWDCTQLLPGMSPFYEAADVLLRLRCITLAELCLARAMSQVGESAAYYHMLTLCCCLRGEYKDALCHVQLGLKKYQNTLYLKSLEGHCYHMLGNIQNAKASYEKCSTSRWPYTVLMMLPMYADPVQRRTVLWDLVRRHPCAYTWMALADVCITEPVKRDDDFNNPSNPNSGASSCAVKALKCDRLAGRAWGLLAKTVKPSARRHYCLKMASLCGYEMDKDGKETIAPSKQSSCYELGISFTECRCRGCMLLRL